MIWGLTPMMVKYLLSLMNIRFRKVWIAFALFAVVGQNVAYAFSACHPMAMNKPAQTVFCHGQASAIDNPADGSTENDCQHVCESLCSGTVTSTGAPQTRLGVQTDTHFMNLTSVPTPELTENLFRPPISG